HANPTHYAVTPDLAPIVPPLGSPPLTPTTMANLGRIGYLYNHFGMNLAANSADGAGMQLAISELEYDATPDLSSGNFVVLPGTDPAALAAAQNYLNLSAGKDERAVYLNVNLPPD